MPHCRGLHAQPVTEYAAVVQVREGDFCVICKQVDLTLIQDSHRLTGCNRVLDPSNLQLGHMAELVPYIHLPSLFHMPSIYRMLSLLQNVQCDLQIKRRLFIRYSLYIIVSSICNLRVALNITKLGSHQVACTLNTIHHQQHPTPAYIAENLGTTTIKSFRVKPST